MTMSFEAFVDAYGIAIWQAGARHRGRRFHQGTGCVCARPGALGGRGSSPECEELFHDAVMEAARRVRPQVWAPVQRTPSATPRLGPGRSSLRRRSCHTMTPPKKTSLRTPRPPISGASWASPPTLSILRWNAGAAPSGTPTSRRRALRKDPNETCARQDALHLYANNPGRSN